jgi:hypothetical protein
MTSAPRPPLARLPFGVFMTIASLLLRRGVGWLMWRFLLLTAWHVRRSPSMGAADSRSLRYESYARMNEFIRRSTTVPLRRGDVRREFTQRLCVVLH